MITEVPKPIEGLTDEERVEFDFHGGRFHRQGKTKHGNIPLGAIGSNWTLVDDESPKGDGYHKIDVLCESEDGDLFFITQTGSQLYIMDETGTTIHEKLTGVEHVDGRVVKIQFSRSEEPEYVELETA